VDILDRLRLRQDQQIVVAADVAMEIGKTLPPKRGLVILQALDHGAHGAVEHQNALRGRRRAGRYAWVKSDTVIGSGGFLCAIGTNAQQMADREHEVRAVHGVEVKGVDAVLGELLHLAGRNGGGDQLARLGVVVEAFEFVCEPVGTVVPARVTKLRACLKLCIGMMPGTIGNIDAAGADAVEIAEVEVVIEEHLRDGARRAGIDLGLQRVDIGVEVGLSGCFSG
jgi:hypothetical protein